MYFRNARQFLADYTAQDPRSHFHTRLRENLKYHRVHSLLKFHFNLFFHEKLMFRVARWLPWGHRWVWWQLISVPRHTPVDHRFILLCGSLVFMKRDDVFLTPDRESHRGERLVSAVSCRTARLDSSSSSSSSSSSDQLSGAARHSPIFMESVVGPYPECDKSIANRPYFMKINFITVLLFSSLRLWSSKLSLPSISKRR
jgi:hypothetical protein